MKIGVISDIHGNLAQLDKALSSLYRENVDLILCAGDLVDFGIDSVGVVSRIVESGIPSVAGNHDRAARSNQPLRQRQIEQGLPVQMLDDRTLERLDQLPLRLSFEFKETTILLAHANPWGDDSLYVVPYSPIPLLKRVAREAQTDIVILGHTHHPMSVVVENCLILNPGSLSNNYPFPFGTYGILALPERTFRVVNVETGHDVRI